MMKKGHIFWGMLLLTIGVLFILRNLNIFYFDVFSFSKLWPLILVFIGISILPVKPGVKLILIGASILIGILILSAYPRHHYSWSFWDNYKNDQYWEPDEHSTEGMDITETYDSKVVKAQLNLNAAAGRFIINDQTGELFTLKSEGKSPAYIVNTVYGDSSANINVRHKKNYKGRDISDHIRLSLNSAPIWDLNIDAGAASLKLDLDPFKVERIDIEGGASKIDLKLGSKSKFTRVNIEAGVSSLFIEIPDETACELRTNTVFSTRDIDGFNKISDKIYQTPNFSDSVSQVIIDVEAAVSSFRIKRY